MRKGMTVKRSRCIIWCRGKSDVVGRLIWTCSSSQAEGKDVLNSDIQVGRQWFFNFFQGNFLRTEGWFQVLFVIRKMKSRCKAYELCLKMKQSTYFIGGDESD